MDGVSPHPLVALAIADEYTGNDCMRICNRANAHDKGVATKLTASKWEQRKKMGRQQYVIRYGVLAFGLGAAILLTLVELVSQGTFTMPFFVVRLLLFPIIGFIWFAYRWDALDRKFSRIGPAPQARK